MTNAKGSSWSEHVPCVCLQGIFLNFYHGKSSLKRPTIWGIFSWFFPTTCNKQIQGPVQTFGYVSTLKDLCPAIFFSDFDTMVHVGVGKRHQEAKAPWPPSKNPHALSQNPKTSTIKWCDVLSVKAGCCSSFVPSLGSEKPSIFAGKTPQASMPAIENRASRGAGLGYAPRMKRKNCVLNRPWRRFRSAWSVLCPAPLAHVAKWGKGKGRAGVDLAKWQKWVACWAWHVRGKWEIVKSF